MATKKRASTVSRKTARGTGARSASKPRIDTRVTQDDVRRAEELIEKHGLQRLRKKS